MLWINFWGMLLASPNLLLDLYIWGC